MAAELTDIGFALAQVGIRVSGIQFHKEGAAGNVNPREGALR